LLTGSAGPCGTADVEITVDDASSSGITLNSLSGVADLGASFAASSMRLDAGRLAAARYAMQTAGAAGHSYAVKLSNGQEGLLTIVSLRNPEVTSSREVANARRNPCGVMDAGTGAASSSLHDLVRGTIEDPPVFLIDLRRYGAAS
jgi:hypothetical protein